MTNKRTITFKTDEALALLLDKLPNKSEFIRDALLKAMDFRCPLCDGSGALSAERREHWQEFLSHHHLEECNNCRETVIVCDHETSSGFGLGVRPGDPQS